MHKESKTNHAALRPFKKLSLDWKKSLYCSAWIHISSYNSGSMHSAEISAVLSSYVLTDPRFCNEKCVDDLQQYHLIHKFSRPDLLRGPTTLFCILWEFLKPKASTSKTHPAPNFWQGSLLIFSSQHLETDSWRFSAVTLFGSQLLETMKKQPQTIQ